MSKQFSQIQQSQQTRQWSFRWFLGMLMASVFSLIYFVAPFYMLTVLILLIRYPTSKDVWMFGSPVFLSALFPPISSPWTLRMLNPLLDYFEYEQVVETHPVNTRREILENKKNYLCICQPHGALSYVGIASAVAASPEFQGKMPTAVADALLYTPILKHVLGIFGLVSASKKSLRRTLQKPGVDGTVVLYVGGMAELFLSCENEERVYLKKRKGFIKLALQEGVDVVPIYLFGNTTVLSVLKRGILAVISRKMQVSLTYIWGRWGLPIPRDCKLMYASGQPLGMPHILTPTQSDIDMWHEKYCNEVTRIFDRYKERVPEYKHKKLQIV